MRGIIMPLLSVWGIIMPVPRCVPRMGRGCDCYQGVKSSCQCRAPDRRSRTMISIRRRDASLASRKNIARTALRREGVAVHQDVLLGIYQV